MTKDIEPDEACNRVAGRLYRAVMGSFLAWDSQAARHVLMALIAHCPGLGRAGEAYVDGTMAELAARAGYHLGRSFDRVLQRLITDGLVRQEVLGGQRLRWWLNVKAIGSLPQYTPSFKEMSR